MSRNARSNVLFALAVVVLATSAVGVKVYDLRVLKKPLPLRKPLRDMNKASLGAWEVVSSSRLPAELVQELGTEEYLNWLLKTVRADEPRASMVSLSVTYYTDVQDQVPHVPEECQRQGGRTPAGGETIELCLPLVGKTIPMKRLAFYARGETEKKNFVYYTIRVNDKFCSDRQAARLYMGDPRDTHLYYSKIELGFDRLTDADVPDLDAAARELFDKLILELEKKHWPLAGSGKNGVGSR